MRMRTFGEQTAQGIIGLRWHFSLAKAQEHGGGLGWPRLNNLTSCAFELTPEVFFDEALVRAET